MFHTEYQSEYCTTLIFKCKAYLSSLPYGEGDSHIFTFSHSPTCVIDSTAYSRNGAFKIGNSFWQFMKNWNKSIFKFVLFLQFEKRIWLENYLVTNPSFFYSLLFYCELKNVRLYAWSVLFCLPSVKLWLWVLYFRLWDYFLFFHDIPSYIYAQRSDTISSAHKIWPKL